MSETNDAPALIERWQTVGTPQPGELGPARTQVHHALLAVAAVERALGEVGGGLEWLEEERALAGSVVPGRRPFRPALRPSDLTLLLLDAENAVLKTFPLDGRTLAEAVAWLGEEARALGTAGERIEQPATDGLPALPEGRFAVARRAEALREMAHWYGNADALLRTVARTTPGASPVRCGLDTLDLSTLLTLPAREQEAPRTVMVGLAPSGIGVDEPCFFVRPSLAPESGELPDLGEAGAWRQVDGTVAVLRASVLVAERDGDRQAAVARTFLEHAIAAAHGFLRRDWKRR